MHAREHYQELGFFVVSHSVREFTWETEVLFGFLPCFIDLCWFPLMVFFCCKRGVTTLKSYPETISPPFLLDSVALPSHLLLQVKPCNLKKWSRCQWERKSRGFTDSMAERSFVLTGFLSYCKKSKRALWKELGHQRKAQLKSFMLQPMLYVFWYQCLYMGILYASNFFWLHVSGCDIFTCTYSLYFNFFSLMPLFSWFWNKASWEEPRLTLAQHNKNCNIFFPHHMLLKSKARKYKFKEYLPSQKNCKLPHKINSFHRYLLLCLRKMIQSHCSKSTEIVKIIPHAQYLSFNLCLCSLAKPGTLVRAPAQISCIKSGGRIEKERRNFLK